MRGKESRSTLLLGRCAEVSAPAVGARSTPKPFAFVGLRPRADGRATMAADEPAFNVRSILVGQQQSGYGPVGFGDDPQRFTRVCLVVAHQPKPVNDAVL